MLLRKILEDSKISYDIVMGSIDIDITDLEYDSRNVKPGVLFACMKGKTSDSHKFATQAAENGAVALLVQEPVILPPGMLNKGVGEHITIINVADSRKAFARLAAAFFGNPADKLKMIGITGTKGKSTTSYMIEAVLKNAGKRIGVIGTIGAVFEDKKWETKLTTPESYDLHRILAGMYAEGCEYVVMEVSSVGLMMDRVEGVEFDYGIYTNLSPDHIGGVEHESFDEYMYCKSLMFKQCKKAFLNIDDEHWKDMLVDAPDCEYKTFGTDAAADFCFKDIECVKANGVLGIEFTTPADGRKYRVNFMGRFNAYNAAIAVCIGYAEGVSYESIYKTLSNMPVVRGRVEEVKVSDKFNLIIDYAHNALSTESLLNTIKEYNPGRIICVFGAGGNRSKLRRYDMGEIAGKYADLSILTADNPRNEEVSVIIDDIIFGMNKSNGKYIIIEDRKEAIRYSIENAKPGDIIALIGKGHEDYQEIKGVKYHFDEREVIADILKEAEYNKQ